MSALSLPLSPEEKAFLDRLASARHSSNTEVALTALRAYLKFESAQTERIQTGIAAADANDFASDAEVDRFFAKYGQGTSE